MQNERYRTWLEIDLGQIRKNYAAIMDRLGKSVCAIAVVKADAYGHGAPAIARALYRAGVDRFAVASLEEAVELRSSGAIPDECEILVLGYTPPREAEWLARYGVSQGIISREYAAELAYGGIRLRSHLAVDTGMNRAGIPHSDLTLITDTLREHGALLGIGSVFTHLCCADSTSDADIEFTKEQLARFEKVYAAVRRCGVTDAHCLNSAGALYHSYYLPAALKSTVRLGIALYGFPPRELEAVAGIRPALKWRTVIAMTKRVRKGESIGYGRSFVAKRDMTLAVLPVGYSDGYPRALSNIGNVLIGNKSAPIIGRVCMNQMMVDVTDRPNTSVGDTVTLVGEESTDASMLASLSGTISYEIISRIGKTIPRIYKDD